MQLDRSILLIDDDKEMTDEVSEILSDEGYLVTAVNEGMQGDMLLKTKKFDLVLLDLKMPDMDGLTILKRLKERGDKTKIIIMTATPLGSDLLNGSEDFSDEDYDVFKMADGIVKKPYNIESMLKIVQDTIESNITGGK